MGTSVNFLSQLEQRRSELAGGSTGLAGRFEAFKAALSEGGALSGRDRVLFGLLLLGVLSIPGSRWYLQNIYIQGKMDIVAAETAQLDARISELQTKINSLAALEAEIASYESKMTELREQISLIEVVQKGRNSLIRMIDFAINEMPTAVFLTKIAIDPVAETPAQAAAQSFGQAVPPPSQPPPGTVPNPAVPAAPKVAPAPNVKGKITIAGVSSSLQFVSEYMKSLEGAVFFPKWTLIETVTDASSVASSTSPQGAPSETKRFDIKADVVSF